jgi:hypothetical protein
MPACEHFRASKLIIAAAIARDFRNVPSIPLGELPWESLEEDNSQGKQPCVM